MPWDVFWMGLGALLAFAGSLIGYGVLMERQNARDRLDAVSGEPEPR